LGCSPGRKSAIVGIDMMLSARDSAGLACTSTFTTAIWSPSLAASFSSSGATTLQ